MCSQRTEIRGKGCNKIKVRWFVWYTLEYTDNKLKAFLFVTIMKQVKKNKGREGGI
jgi:hypothetical protein